MGDRNSKNKNIKILNKLFGHWFYDNQSIFVLGDQKLEKTIKNKELSLGVEVIFKYQETEINLI